jgi:hypothetical protein
MLQDATSSKDNPPMLMGLTSTGTFSVRETHGIALQH